MYLLKKKLKGKRTSVSKVGRRCVSPISPLGQYGHKQLRNVYSPLCVLAHTCGCVHFLSLFISFIRSARISIKGC